MGRKKINETSDDTITITIRNVKTDEWDKLGDYIGGRSKSEFLRECITKQIGITDTVSELKKEIHELDYQISMLEEERKEKKKKLGELLKSQEDNADNELMLDTIIKTILDFNNKYGGISEQKIKSMMREDFNDAIPVRKVINHAKELSEINWVDNLDELITSKAYNRKEKKEVKEEKSNEEIIYEYASKHARYWNGESKDPRCDYTALNILEKKEVNKYFEKRCKELNIDVETAKKYIKDKIEKS